MPVTTSLLARLRSLDDLTEFTRELGFRAAPADLGPEARERLGLGGLPSIRRAAVLARHGHFHVYGFAVRSTAREVVATTVERLARHTSDRFLLLALDDAGETLALGCPVASPHGAQGRVMRVSLSPPSRATAEILGGLAPRPGERALALAARIGDILEHEGLTARFFRELRRLHERAAAHVAHARQATGEERRGLALLYLTRVLFLYFIQTKGWLAGRSDFLPSLLDLALARSHSFHGAVFAPLCFGALAAPPASRRGVARALGAVPFLNSGLFERHALERRFPQAELPNDTWRELFDDLFERFHFTVRESDDADAVDPEMLGRVFEGLMARDRRREAGAYYTPRALLRRLVHETLDAALAGANAARVRGVRILDPAVGSGAFLLEALAWLEPRRAALLNESPAQRRRAIIRDNLFGVDMDPMAVRLAELRLWLALVADEPSPDAVCPLPNLDQNLRQGDSLLAPLDLGGARAPEAAVHVRAVAEARAAYFAAAGTRKTTLARRIRAHEHAIALACADADLARATARLADAVGGRDLFGRRPVRSSVQERATRRWKEQRQDLRRLRARIAQDDTLPFFAYDVHFGEIVADGGFDVVLGNPPWVRGERLSPRVREQLAARYQSFRPASAGHGFAHLPDLSVAFVERSLQLVREGGILGLVLPAKLLRAGYAAPLRAILRRETSLLLIEDRSHATHGFGATVFPMLCVVRRARRPAAAPLRVVLYGRGRGGPITGMVEPGDLPLDPDAPRSPWLLAPGAMGAAVRAALRAGPPLMTRFRPRLGVKTGANDVFLRDRRQAGDLPARWTRPAIHGRDITPFRATPGTVIVAALEPSGRPLAVAPDDVAAYLAPHHALLARRADALRAPPWALFRTELLPAPWLVVWRDIAEQLEVAPLDRRDTAAPIPLNTCYGIAVDDETTAWWLSAWLNSGPLRTVACAIAERGSGGAFRFSATTVGTLPLPPTADPELSNALARLGRAAADGEPRSLDDLDSLVADALGLSPSAAAGLAQLGAALRRDPGRRR